MVGSQDRLPLEVLPTRGAFEQLVTSMRRLVEPEPGPVRKDLSTLAAMVGLVLTVVPSVGDESYFLVETSPADGACQGPLLTPGSREAWGWQRPMLPCGQCYHRGGGSDGAAASPPCC